MTVGVFTDHAPYGQVLGGFATSAGRAASATGSVVALPGMGDWPALLEGAVRAGAVSAVVDDPVEVPGVVLTRLRSMGLPVILERPRLRYDLCVAAVEARAGVPARAIVVECAGGDAERTSLLRDSVGWARVIAGGELVFRSAGRSGAGLVCLLDGPDDVPVTVTFTRSDFSGASGLIRLSALGETRSEVTLDLLAGVAEIDTVTVLGTHRAPPRHESSHRLALGRAMQAASTGATSMSDLRDLFHDSALASTMRGEAYRPY